MVNLTEICAVALLVASINKFRLVNTEQHLFLQRDSDHLFRLGLSEWIKLGMIQGINRNRRSYINRD